MGGKPRYKYQVQAKVYTELGTSEFRFPTLRPAQVNKLAIMLARFSVDKHVEIQWLSEDQCPDCPSMLLRVSDSAKVVCVHCNKERTK